MLSPVRTLFIVASLGVSALLMFACSPSTDNTATSSREIAYPIGFNWKAPARLNVRETLTLDGRPIKVRYDVNVKAHESRDNHVVLSFSNASPIEFDGEQVLISSYTTDVQEKLRLILSDFYSRPSLVINPSGEVVEVTDIEKSVRALVDLSYPNDVPKQLQAYERAVRNAVIQSKVETNSYNVYGCLIEPWINFTTPEQQSVESPGKLVLVDGGEPVSAVLTQTNHGVDANGSDGLHLESVSKASGTELANMMLDLTFQMKDSSEARPNMEGIATAYRLRKSEVKLDPDTLQPTWARCETHFVIDSSDNELLPSTDKRRSAEFEVQWL